MDHQHQRFGVFNAMNRRSDSIESHGSISSLSSTHSSVNGGNGGNCGGTPSVELSRYRRVEPPRSLNTSCSARNSGHACHVLPRDAKIKSSRPSMMLLHSTSMMETPGRQQTLNRSRSGSCPVVWEVSNSVREHPAESPKWRQLPSGFAASPSSSYGPRPDERSPYGQRTGSVQYAASQNDCRFLGGAAVSQGSGILSPNWDVGGLNYDRWRMFERCPTENCLSDLARSPNVVSSLQRSLSTMSMGAVPNSSFTSKLNCNLSKSYTNKLNGNGREHINESKKDARSGRPNAFQAKLPSSMEMGINYNPPKSGQVRRQREVFEKDSTRKESSFSPKTAAPFENRRHFKYRSFENISSASSQLSAVTLNENRSNGELNCITPVENRFGRRQPGLRLVADKCDDLSVACTPSDGKYNKLLASAHDVRSKSGSVAITRKSNEFAHDSYANSVNSDDGELDNTPDTPSPDKNWSWSPLKPLSNSQNGKKVGGSLTSLRSVTAAASTTAATSDNDPEPKSPERFLEVAMTPRNEEKSKYVSEMFVSIAKPRPASGSAKDFPGNPGAPGRRPLLSLSSYDLPSKLNPRHSSISRSSLPLAVSAADKTQRNERFPSANSAATRNRRHSNPMEKTSEISPDVRLHIANQKEAFTVLLRGINDLYQYRENLRIHVTQLENEVQDRRATSNQKVPSVYDLEKLYESNSQLKLKVQQLSREFELAKSKTSKGNANGDGAGGAWSCSACTFMNHPALNLCECCELPRLSFAMR